MSAADDGQRPGLAWGARPIPRHPDATVLEALEAAGIPVVSGCRAGSCGKCLQRSLEAPPAAAQRGLRATLASQNYFYSCQARPQGTLTLVPDEPPVPLEASVLESASVGPDVRRLLLRTATPLDYRPGQYLDLLTPEGIARSYSVASLPDSGVLEFHVRRIEGGAVSPWLHSLAPGDELRVRGPFGQCFYTSDATERALLLVGAGTGLAPLLGIARAAVQAGHRAPIDLVHGALEPGRLYLRDELRAFAAQHPNVNIHACVLRDAGPDELQGPLEQVSLGLAGDLTRTRVFLCGDGELVAKLQRSCFLAGVPSGEIFADPFLAPPAPGAAAQAARAVRG